MNACVQTLKENRAKYFLILILLLLIGAAGWLARFTLVIGFAKHIELYPIMVLYILFSAILLWLAGLGEFPSGRVLQAILAVSLGYTLLCFMMNTEFSSNVPLCALTAMAEILLCCPVEYGLRRGAGKTVYVPRLLLKGLVFLVLALAFIRLAYREQIRLLPFYRTGTDAWNALRSEIMTGASTVISILIVLWLFALFITEKTAYNTTGLKLDAHAGLAILSILIILVTKQIFSGVNYMSFTSGTNRGHRFSIGKYDTLWCSLQGSIYSESGPRGKEEIPYERSLCRISASYEKNQKNEVLYSFRTAAGISYENYPAGLKYVTTFADEVIVVNGERKWEFLAPAATAGMEEDPDLLDAIRDGIENGRLLLAVDCLDYLCRYDPDYTADLLGRWSRGSFTEGERSRSGWFSLAHFTNWAQKQI